MRKRRSDRDLKNCACFFSICLVLLIISGRVEAVEVRNIRFETLDGPKTFLSIPQWRWTISEQCLVKKDSKSGRMTKSNFRCQAIRALKKASSTSLQISGSEGQNPGSLVCAMLKGKIIYALQNKNQITFCLFEDGSMVSSGSLASSYFNKGSAN